MAISYNRDYLRATLSRFNIMDSDIDVIMAETPELEGPLNVQSCKLAIYQSMSTILPTVDVSESGYSVTWNIEALKLWYGSLCNELGRPNVMKPKIRNRSNIW